MTITKEKEEISYKLKRFILSNIEIKYLELLIVKLEADIVSNKSNLQFDIYKRSSLNSLIQLNQTLSKNKQNLEKSKKIQQELLPILTSVYDSILVQDINSEVMKLTSEDLSPSPPLGKIDRTQRTELIYTTVTSRFSTRVSGGARYLREFTRTSVYGLNMKRLVQLPIKDAMVKKIDTTDRQFNTLPYLSNKTKEQINKINETTKEQLEALNKKLNEEYKAVKNAGGNVNPNSGLNNVEPLGDSKKTLKIGEQKIPVIIPTELEQDTVKSLEIFKPNIVFSVPTTDSKIVIEGTKGETQFLETDKIQIDPRKINLFMPQSHINQIPAYFSITGGLGVIKNDIIKDPFQTSSGIKNKVYNQFMLTQTIEMYNEKFQLEDTFSSGSVSFFFGEKPEIWTFSGLLYNDLIHGWHTKMRELWHDYIRGTVLAEKGKYLSIIIPSTWLRVDCYPIGLTISHNVESENVSPFTMSVIIKKARTLNIFTNRLNFSTDGKGAIKTLNSIVDVLNKLQQPELPPLITK